MLVIAKGLTNAADFDTKDLDGYELEVIGGNHRREVVSRIMATSPDAKTKDLYKFVYVQIYAGELFFCAENLVILKIPEIACQLSVLTLYAENVNTHATVNLHACYYCLLLAEVEMKMAYTFSTFVDLFGS